MHLNRVGERTPLLVPRLHTRPGRTLVRRTIASARRAPSLAALTLGVGLAATPTHALAQESGDPPWRAGADGRQLYQAACAACHGSGGTGVPHTLVGFDTPLPDFTDCSFATREADADWAAVVHGGGPVRGFARAMPAFGSALTQDEIQRILDYVRTFCTESGWPRGELNFPRALATEKAYPEDEAVLTFGSSLEGGRTVDATLVYERRVGARNQVEVTLPFHVREPEDHGGWTRGVGDVAVGVKRVLHQSFASGRIVAAALELVLPTGEDASGLGAGTVALEPFLAFGQALPSEVFFQLQGGVEVPLGGSATEEAFARGAAGKTFIQGRYARAWTPMLELLAARELEPGADVELELIPQVQVTLNTRQHVLLNAGLGLPLDAGGDARLLVYVLWDWFDGGFLDGW